MKTFLSFQTKSTANFLKFTEKNNYLCTANTDNDIDIYDTKKAKIIFKIKNHQDQVVALDCTEDHQLVSASQDRTVKIFDLNSFALKDSIL